MVNRFVTFISPNLFFPLSGLIAADWRKAKLLKWPSSGSLDFYDAVWKKGFWKLLERMVDYQKKSISTLTFQKANHKIRWQEVTDWLLVGLFSLNPFKANCLFPYEPVKICWPVAFWLSEVAASRGAVSLLHLGLLVQETLRSVRLASKSAKKILDEELFSRFYATEDFNFVIVFNSNFPENVQRSAR